MSSEILRFLSIKFPRKSPEYYQVKYKINYDPECKLIISCSLFGDMNNPVLYKKYFLPLLQKRKSIYPGSNVRIYIDPTIPDKLINRLANKGFEIHVMNHPSRGYSGTLWRFLAFGDKSPEAAVFMSEADISLDDYFAEKGLDFKEVIDRWFKSSKKFLLIGSHLVYVPFSASRIGMKDIIIPNITEKINEYEGRRYGEDEIFLKREIWPLVQKEGYDRVYIKKEMGIITIICIVVIILLILIIIFLYKSKYG